MRFRVVKEWAPLGNTYFKTKKEALAYIEKTGGKLQKKMGGQWFDWE
jgi:hypothetical protein